MRYKAKDRGSANSPVMHNYALLCLLPMLWPAAGNQLNLSTSIPCELSTPLEELAAIASTKVGFSFTPAVGCNPGTTAVFHVEGPTETELVALLLRWELDVSYGGYELNALTAISVNGVKVGKAPTRAFLSARQVSGPMGVTLAAFASSGIASIMFAVAGHPKRESPAQCYVVVGSTFLSESFY